jgi:transposase
MKKKRSLSITPQQYLELEKGIKQGKSRYFRRRCQCVLLREEGHSIKEIADILGASYMSVTEWLKQYDLNGLSGLRLHKTLFKINTSEEKKMLFSALKSTPHSIKQAHEQWVLMTGKKISYYTFYAYAKRLLSITKKQTDVYDEIYNNDYNDDDYNDDDMYELL